MSLSILRFFLEIGSIKQKFWTAMYKKYLIERKYLYQFAKASIYSVDISNFNFKINSFTFW